MRSLALSMICLWLFDAAPLTAHEFWVAPQQYQVESGAPLVANLKNGENFEGIDLAYFETRTQRFELWQDGTASPYTGRLGDIPALKTLAPAEGLLVIVHQTRPSTIKYKSWDKFQAFADHKDFPDIRTRHAARGLPEADFFERYTRFAKALVAVGAAQGQDAVSGMETEFVALGNPYTDAPEDGLRVRLLYQGAPRADAQVEIFERAPGGQVTVTTRRTDAGGETVIPVRPAHDYLLDAVVLRPLEGERAVWESLWAALTFHVP